MAGDDPSDRRNVPLRARRWTGGTTRRPNAPYRLIFRLLGIPMLAVAGVIIYRGLEARLVLPACDSERAQQTLAEVLKELKLEPVKYAPIKTISSSKDKVVCNATMPLPDGATVVADYTFYWDGDKANMRYSIRREPAKSSSLDVPRLAILNTLFDDRMDLHFARLHEAITWSRQPVMEMLNGLAAHMPGSDAQAMALRQIFMIVH
jgi:hypothetical protein